MEDSTLFKIAMFCAVVGITILLLIDEKIDLANSNIASISSAQAGQEVKIKGFVTDIKTTEKIIIVQLKDYTGEISVIIFNNKDIINFKKNSILEVVGVVKVYNSQLEIEAKKIKSY